MKKILVIEDDSHIGNMLEELLTGAGYLVSRAYSGTRRPYLSCPRKSPTWLSLI